MTEGNKILNNTFDKYMSGYALSRAVIDDYVRTAAKLENVEEGVVRERIEKRAQEIFDEALGPVRKANMQLGNELNTDI